MLRITLRSHSIIQNFVSCQPISKKKYIQNIEVQDVSKIGRLQLLKFTDNLYLKQGDIFEYGTISEEIEKFTHLELKNISNFDSEELNILSIVQEKNIERFNEKGREYNGYLGLQAQRDIKRIIDTWTESTICQNILRVRQKKKKVHLPTFVTLTYPSEQRHDDNYLKREHLNNFIITAKRKWDCKKYIWKAEIQKNGNLHFHFLMDCYIQHEVLRKTWNDIIQGDNYISEFEKKHKHRNPNSTDIKSLAKVTNISNYISKYCAKIEIEKTGIRKINGRVWGCSDNVRLIRQPNILGLMENKSSNLDNTELINELTMFLKDNNLMKRKDDISEFATYIELKEPIREILGAFNFVLNNLYHNHYNHIFNLIN